MHTHIARLYEYEQSRHGFASGEPMSAAQRFLPQASEDSPQEPPPLQRRPDGVGSKAHLVHNMALVLKHSGSSFSHDDARRALDAASYAIAHSLVNGDYVTLPYLGKFTLHKHQKGVRQTLHGKRELPERHVPRFKPAPWLRQQVHRHRDGFEYRGAQAPVRYESTEAPRSVLVRSLEEAARAVRLGLDPWSAAKQVVGNDAGGATTLPSDRVWPRRAFDEPPFPPAGFPSASSR